MGFPRVTFLMAVHNGAGTVAAAIESMLAQRQIEIELVVVDDGSTDGTAELLQGMNDPRMTVVRHETNRGLSWSLNWGWKLARGDYVARMDADDMCLPERAARQAAFLDERREVAVVGSFVETFTSDGTAKKVMQYPTEAGAVGATILFRNALAHPAVMVRKAAIDGAGLRFEERYRAAQDYALWAKCVEKGLALANVPEVLLRYRVHEAQLSRQFSEGMQEEGRVIREGLLRTFDPTVNGGELVIHNRLSRDQLLADEIWVRGAAAWLEKLAAINERRAGGRMFEKEALMRVLTGRYVALQRFTQVHEIEAPDPAASAFAKYIRADALGGVD